MKRRLASLFRWLEDHLDPSRRRLEADRLASLENTIKLANTSFEELRKQQIIIEALQRESAPVLPPDIAPDWLPEHQAALRAFLCTSAGLILLQRGRFIHFETAKKATADVFHTTHSAGLAEGWGKCLEWVLSLSRTSRAPDVSVAEPHTNTASNGESKMRERLSP